MSVWVDHFSLAVQSLDEAEAFFSRYLPLVALGGSSSGADGEVRARLYQLGHVKLALVESARAGSFLERFLARRGEGIHHLALRTADLAPIAASLEEAGFTVVEVPASATARRAIGVRPQDASGMFLLIGETDDAPPARPAAAERIVAMPGVDANMVFDHLAAAVPGIEPVKKFFAQHFPVTRDGGTHRGYAGDFDISQFELAGYRFELISDASGTSFIVPFLAKRGPGFHHLSIDVDRIDPILDRMRADGLRIVDEADLGYGYKTAFVSPRSAHGVLVQFWQVPDLTNEDFADR
ncbi:MAG: VOC family protein [Deltaproteobacteria bacterium]